MTGSTRHGSLKSRMASRVVAGVCSATLLLGVSAVQQAQASPPSSSGRTDATSTTIRMPAAQVDRAWWVADALLENRGDALPPFVYFQRLLQTIYADDPGLAPKTAAAQIALLRAAVSHQLGRTLASLHGDSLVPGILAAVQRASHGKRILGTVREAVAVTGQWFESTAGTTAADAATQVTASLDFGAQTSLVEQAATDVLGATALTADKRSEAAYRTAENLAFAATTAPTTASARKIITANPQMAALSDVNALIRPDGTVVTNAGSLDTLAQTAFDKAQAQQDEAQATLATLNAEQQNVLAYSKSDHSAEQAADHQKAAAEQDVLGQVKGTVSLISNILLLGDPAAAKTVQKVGSAIVDIATSVSKFVDVVSKVGSVANAIGSLAGVIATGNIIGAVMNLVSLFGGGPSADQMILQEIAKLQKQVENLGKEMDARFDRIDKALNTMYATMTQQFDLINTKLDRLDANVTDVLDRLAGLQTQLADLEGGLWSTLRDGFRRPLWDEIDSALGYRARTGKPLPGADFLSADSSFYTWGTRNAYDAAATGPTDRSTDETTLATELDSYPLDDNTSFLAVLPQAFGLASLSTSPLPNPHDWVLAARAYAALVQDYPELAQQNRVLASEVATLRTGGARLQAFERNITAGELDADGLNPLFATLISRYDAATRAVGADIAGVEQDYRLQEQLDPYGGLTQSLPKATTPTAVGCGAPNKSVPAALSSRLITGSMQLEMNYTSAGAFDLCAVGEWVNITTTAGKYPSEHGDLQATIESRWIPAGSSTPVIVRSQTAIIMQDALICSTVNTECNEVDPQQQMYTMWSTATSDWQATSQVDVTSEQQQLDTAATDLLTQKQSEMISKVHTAFSTEPLHSDAARMSGDAVALRDYVLVGMPRSYAGDELLSSLLSGADTMVGEDGVQTLTDAYLGTPSAEPWAQLLQTITDRRDAVVACLARDIAAIRAGAVDGSVAVATTMDRLATLVATVTSPGVRFIAGSPSVNVPATRIHRARTVTVGVANPGLGRLHVSKVRVTGTRLHLLRQTCTSVAGHRRCAITLRYAPVAVGRSTGSVRLFTNTARRSVVLTLHLLARR